MSLSNLNKWIIMKILLALIVVLTSLSVSAQSRSNRTSPRMTLRDGHSIVRIVIDDREDLSHRVRRLEEAVMDLQDQVYDLRDQPRTRIVKTQVCTLKRTFHGTFIGKAQTQIEAEAIARNQCE